MTRWIRAVSTACTLLLTACGGGGQAPGSAGPETTDFCLDCKPPEKLLSLPQLENGLFTSGGRLFVSGQSNLYEIHRDGSGYRSEALFPDGGGCSGLAEDRQTLYALCSGSAGPTDFSGLYTLSLTDAAAVLQFSFSLSDMSLPNGMVAAHGRLYITDGPVATEPKIVSLDIDPEDPQRILSQSTWLATPLDNPNGLAFDGAALYVTYYQPGFGGQVRRVPIGPDGTAGSPEDLVPREIMDDLTVLGETLIVTDWQAGALFQIDLAGNLLQETASNTFAQPSSVTLAGPPLFDQPTLLITERYTGDGLWALR